MFFFLLFGLIAGRCTYKALDKMRIILASYVKISFGILGDLILSRG